METKNESCFTAGGITQVNFFRRKLLLNKKKMRHFRVLKLLNEYSTEKIWNTDVAALRR